MDHDIDRSSRPSRRTVLKGLGALGLAAGPALGVLDALGWAPERLAHAAPQGYPDIQFDLGAYVPPARRIEGVDMAMPPVYTVFLTAVLTRPGAPSGEDRRALADALDTIEARYPFTPAGVFAHVSYGLPYFRRLRGGLAPGGVAADHLPMFKATGESVLQESVPGPSDVSARNPGVAKQTFNVPLRIERNDVLFTLRGDLLANLTDVVAWLKGSGRLNGAPVPSPAFDGLFAFTSLRVMFVQMLRVMFVQIGMPHNVARRFGLPYAERVNPLSPMWMGFFSQQKNGFGPAEIATFQGNASAHFTGMPRPGGGLRPVDTSDYFYNGAIQVFAHDILDLAQWYADGRTYDERVALMFRPNPAPSRSNYDPYRYGGGPAVVSNDVVLNRADGTSDAAIAAATLGKLGHVQALQRVTRAPDGVIVPQRVDGPGFDAMDVPDGSPQPKLQFSVFLPSAQNFAKARTNAAAPDLSPSKVPASHNGIEPFMTATRRQNFLCPPRAHRAFPLLELG